ncbi:LysR family transcriptional regulator [Nonomuraea sp. bgisy101]|uniref:LysR family transcriptional regulator n=1 Tax=Nonomuraea sp. bgisy101 TaxID=3413784 RepID=UPI003D704EE8
MELRQLDYFVAVAEEANFTRAAERLHVAQPWVSAQIRQLERELGQPLFDRSGRTVSLTEVGAAVLPYARAALSAVEGARRTVDEFAGLVRGRVAIGTSSSLASLIDLPELLTGFHLRHPAVEITLTEDTTDGMIERVRAGRLDLAVLGLGRTTPPDISLHTIAADALVVAVAHDDPFARRTSLTLQDIAERPLICLREGTGMRTTMNEAFAAARIKPHIAFEASDVNLLIQLTAKGLGVAVLPEPMVRKNAEILRAVPLDQPRLTGRLVLAWRSQEPATPAARALISHMRRALDTRPDALC